MSWKQAQTLSFSRIIKNPKLFSAKYQKRQFLTLSHSLYICNICLIVNGIYSTRKPELQQYVHFCSFQLFPRKSATHNNLYSVNVRFSDIICRLAWILPSIHFANGGENGIVSVRTLIKKFGSASGVMMELQQIIASPD